MHYWECESCGGKFKTDDSDDYGSGDPQVRGCLLCDAVGGVLYHGYSGALPYVQKDDLGKGIRSQIDGKMYDSKSAYYKSVKNSGHVIVGNETQKNSNEVRGDFDCSKELKEAWQYVKSKQPRKKGRRHV